MLDINGFEVRIGDIVKIDNSPIKADNALYVVAQDGTSKVCCSKDLTLYKVAKHKDGYSLSKSKYNICFYPLCNFSSRYRFSREEMNAATIEVIIRANSDAFYIVKNCDQYENEETENTQLIAVIKSENESIEDVSYLVSEKEKLIAFFSNLTLKQGETIDLVKSDYTWGYYPKDISYKLVKKIPEKEETQEHESDPAPQKEQPKREISVKYYAINESTARTANDINSFSDYKKDSATKLYRFQVDSASQIAQKQIEKYPDEEEKVLYYIDRYSSKLASYYNDYYRNEAACPSIMICGAGNFPVKKKNAQNSRRETLQNEYEYIEKLLDKIKSIGKCGIQSGDKNAIEKLEIKVQKLEKEHTQKMYWNKYYKQHGTLKGCEGLTDQQVEKIDDFIKRNPSFSPFCVVNDTANIRRYKQRIEDLQKVKESTKENEVVKSSDEIELFTVAENTDTMRLQLFFDGKPDEGTRDVLKKHGFRWSPKNSAWQRQLTDNARYSLKLIKAQLAV